MKTALVTGAAGFIGAHLARRLLKESGLAVVALDDLSGGFRLRFRGVWRSAAASKTFYKIGDFLDDLPTLYRLDWVDLNRAAPSVRNAALHNNMEVLYG